MQSKMPSTSYISVNDLEKTVQRYENNSELKGCVTMAIRVSVGIIPPKMSSLIESLWSKTIMLLQENAR